MGSFRIINKMYGCRQHFHFKVTIKIEFSVHMEGNFFGEAYTQFIRLVIIHFGILNMRSPGHHGQNFQALEQIR